MTDSKCESAISKFCDFVSNDVKKNSIEFHDFDEASYRLDVFYIQSSCFKIQKTKESNFVLKLIFTVSHGNVSVERRFTVNNFIFRKQYVIRNHYCTTLD